VSALSSSASGGTRKGPGGRREVWRSGRWVPEAEAGPEPTPPETSSGPAVRRLVEEAGSLEAALKANHPDHGGHPRALQDVLAYREATR
jgi:hypothetical protein